MHPTQRTQAADQKHRQKREDEFPWFEVSLVGGFFMVFIMPVLALVSVFLLFQAFDLIYPGVYIGETSIWGLSRESAISKVDGLWNEEHLLVITDGQRDWSASPADFGLWVSSSSAVEQAYTIGRGSDALYDFLELLTGKTYTFEPQVIFYPEIAQAELERWAQVIDIEGYPTGVRYQQGEWLVVPGRDGLALDIAATQAELSADPGAVISSGVLVFSMFREDYNLGETQVSIENILPQLEMPLRITAYDPITDSEEDWQVGTGDLAAMIQIVDGEKPHPHIDTQSFTAYLDAYLSDLNSQWAVESEMDLADLDAVWQNGSAYDITIWHKPVDYIVQAGDSLNGLGLENGMPYWHIMDANPSLYDSGLHAGQVIRIPSKNDLLPLPVIRGKRIEISIARQRMSTFLNGTLQDEYIISTGVASSPTHPGVFQVQTHELNAYASVWDLYMPHFLGIYEGWPGFMNGIHGLPTLSSGNILWADVLGSPASYGCIILDLDDAEDLYHWAEDGVVVEITP